ncbi:right-handed parallel beta-helix repeat-containing protein [Isoptericola sp. b441]|uniref:Right-handed parallel beta-helix repeat-containing protein n=1 Tax=Actinotalea lenta TaxID=3064654 RepID=A0ABT9D7H6_9CELL|nr:MULTISPECIES: right-handed parallel beta-helix repeat-containing protein [unclassified Isoptericola]MDO8106800.1 right-handed parallel beta-helix repeat-containing protein [Isoptericola sp. b441]MDO8121489.1 right-handed parallel beta-helix repeat-containing protein [Isoptericola sp. b490]
MPAGTSLTVHQGDLTITQPGTVIDSLDVHGLVRIETTGVTVRDSVIRGRPVNSPTALVTVQAGSGATIVDSTIVASTASPYLNGVQGAGFTLRRVEVANVIDQVHITGSDVRVVDSWLHGNAHFAQDPTRNGAPSHDDNVQIQVGARITITHNDLSGSHNAAIMLTQDAGRVSSLSISDNWLDDGTCVVNIKDQGPAPQGVALTDNTFGRGAVYPNCGIKVPNTTYPLELQRNFFIDGVPVGRTA